MKPTYTHTHTHARARAHEEEEEKINSLSIHESLYIISGG